MIRTTLSSALLVGLASAQVSQQPLVANSSSAITNPVSPNSPIPLSETDRMRSLEIPPLPKGRTTLLGGTIQKVDHVRDKLILQVFGGGRTAVLFDERTNVSRQGQVASLDDLKSGQRAYVDTTLDGTAIFARNIRIADHMPMGHGSGQVVDFRPASGELLIRDTISPEPVKMRLAHNAEIRRGDSVAQPSDLLPGTLVTLTFTPANDVATVQQVSILASPGQVFVFAGRLEHIDLSRGLLVVVDPRDNKSYDVYFDSSVHGSARDLREGAKITVEATFDGTRYHSRDIRLNPSM